MRALPGAVLPFPLNFSRKENSPNTGTRALHAPSNLTRDDEREFDGIDRLRDVDLVAGRQSAYPIFSACVCGQCHRWNPGTMLSLPPLFEERTKVVLAGKPHHHRRGICQQMKQSFTLLKGFCRALSFCDVPSNLGSADYLSSRFFNR